VVAASIRTHGATAVDVFKLTDSSTGGQLSSEKFEALRRGVAHRARRQAISQSLGHAPSSSLAAVSPAAPPPPEDMAVIDAACVTLPPFKSLITSERHEARAACAWRRMPARTSGAVRAVSDASASVIMPQIYAEMHQLRFNAGETLILEGMEVQQFVVLHSGDVVGTHRCACAAMRFCCILAHCKLPSL
jgi:hypothetical protein